MSGRNDADAKRRHREATSKALKGAVYYCPKCGRGQLGTPRDVGDGTLFRVCRYCKHEWTARDRA